MELTEQVLKELFKDIIKDDFGMEVYGCIAKDKSRILLKGYTKEGF